MIRSAIQLNLPEIFYFFQEYLPTLSGRFTTKQFTDRVNALLVIWSDWAIYPTAYINGLETMLNQTEFDLQQFMTYIPSQSELDEDIYTLKRHAKFHGISSNLEIYFDKFGNVLNEDINNIELREKYVLCRLLTCIKNYVKIKENSNEVQNIKSIEIIEEIDGVPVDIGVLNNSIGGSQNENQIKKVDEINTVSLPIGKRDGWVDIEINNEVENEDEMNMKENSLSTLNYHNNIDEDIDDIDGVPIDEGGEDEDDIDGVPLDDDNNNIVYDSVMNNNVNVSVSNYEYDDDDIDGVPLPDDM